MSRDARNSILLWLGSLAVFGFAFAIPYLDVPTERPAWRRDLIDILNVIGLCGFIYGLWLRRRSNPNNPNNPDKPNREDP